MTIRTISKQHTGGVTGKRVRPGWMTDGRSVGHSFRPPKITVILTCNVPTVCHQSALSKRSALFSFGRRFVWPSKNSGFLHPVREILQ
jgi:hypothetical protein